MLFCIVCSCIIIYFVRVGFIFIDFSIGLFWYRLDLCNLAGIALWFVVIANIIIFSIVAFIGIDLGVISIFSLSFLSNFGFRRYCSMLFLSILRKSLLQFLNYIFLFVHVLVVQLNAYLSSIADYIFIIMCVIFHLSLILQNFLIIALLLYFFIGVIIDDLLLRFIF